MKYLMYYIDGFIKKFPLKESEAVIGRQKKCDLVLDSDSISRQHVKVHVGKEIIVEDLGSTNGVYIRNVKVDKAVIEVGDSFNLGGGIEFFLREGNLDEFKTSEELKPIFMKINKDIENESSDNETRYLTDIYTEILKYIVKSGFRRSNFNHFIHDLTDYLSQLTNFGSLVLISQKKKERTIHFSIEKIKNFLNISDTLLDNMRGIFKDKIRSVSVKGSKFRFYSYPLKLGDRNSVMIYIPLNPVKEEEKRIEDFLHLLSKEISLLYNILDKGKSDIKEIEDNKNDSDNSIICVNRGLKNLIDQSVKIAKSDVFVLIEGESGTGKELFARLIHNNSKRIKSKFVAINCAAIPENLLESELFGHEKGAFTDAYSTMPGKLELASAGTLVLDEIGDMPLNLQSKLLRVLQENEFYRVGGTTPIKVDLRIISLTNKELSKLVAEGKFREDLFYRLVHHKISIPPLRERREDITQLINHFTGKYSKEIGKNIHGYTIQVFKTMEKYEWPGNIRQLQNEVRRLVNLVDSGENIKFDLLSEDIRMGTKEKDTDKFETSSIGKFQTEQEFLIDKLQKNNWNKSKTALELKMTYNGLHKKMKRLGIKKPDSH
ncbi:MAG: sigma 54-interacting transcriptional regulator [Acidobacteriota bacterium]